METTIMAAYKAGVSEGRRAFVLTRSDPAWEGRRAGEEPPEGWALEAASASGYNLEPDAELSAPTGAWVAGYFAGWRSAWEDRTT